MSYMISFVSIRTLYTSCNIAASVVLVARAQMCALTPPSMRVARFSVAWYVHLYIGVVLRGAAAIAVLD